MKTCPSCGRLGVCPLATAHEPSPSKWCGQWIAVEDLPATVYQNHINLLKELIKLDKMCSDKVDVVVYEKLVKQQDRIRKIVKVMT